MMRHAMGIICVFFPEETGPDLKSTEVNGGFPSYFSNLWISPPALHKPADPSPLHQKKPPPLLYFDAPVHWYGFAELITVGNGINIPSDGCATAQREYLVPPATTSSTVLHELTAG